MSSGGSRIIRRKAETQLNARCSPLPLAGEGWGEGNLVEAFRTLALTLPSPASGRGEKQNQSDGGGGASTVRFPFVSGGVTMPCCSMTSISLAARL